MAWLSGSKRMQYHGIGSQLNTEAGRGSSSQVQTRNTEVKQFGDNSTRSGISLLPGFNDANWSKSNTRVRTGVKMQEPSTGLAVHDGGGDVPRPPTSYTARATRARKAAQMEYKAELDKQVAERKKMKDLEKSQNTFGTVTMSTGPICGTSPVQYQPLPLSTGVSIPKNGVSNWLATSPPPTSKNLHDEMVSCNSSTVKSQGSNGDETPTTSQNNITFSPFPPMSSKSLPACHQLSVSSENHLREDIQRGHGQSSIIQEVKSSPNSVTTSQSSPQLLKSENQVYPVTPVRDRSMMDESLEDGNVTQNLLPQFSSTPIAIPSNQTSEKMESYSLVNNGTQQVCGGDATCASGVDGTCSPCTYSSQFLSDEYTGSPSPHAGTSPCGSYIGDSCSMTGSGSFTKHSYKPHVSQTADQRPEPSILRTNYKAELETQIQERKRLEEERLKAEREDEEKLQSKIKQDQERMRKEYEEEQLKMKEKEEEKRQRQEENLQRLKEVEAERQKEIQERRDRLKAVSASTEPTVSQETFVEFKPSASPPIPTLSKFNDVQECILPIATENSVKVPIPETTPSTTNAGGGLVKHNMEVREERPRQGSGLTETLQFLEQVRDILNQELAASQSRFQQEMEELKNLCSE